jgi:hypothetical protein
MNQEAAPDNCERRSGVDRRSFAYAVHIPERRTGKERRKGLKRRYRKSADEMTPVEKGN